MEENKNPTPDSTHISTKPKKDFFSYFGKLVLILILAAILLGGGYYWGSNFSDKSTRTSKTSITPSINQDQSPVQSITTPSDTPASKKTLSFTSQKMKDLSYPSFSINYPDDWTKNEKIDQIMQEITFSKNDYEIIVWQGPTGGNMCIFEGTLPEGPATDYRESKYVQISTGIGIIRRVGENNKFSFCQENQNEKGAYFLPTTIGGITYKLPDDPDLKIIEEMDQILSTIKTN